MNIIVCNDSGRKESIDVAFWERLQVFNDSLEERTSRALSEAEMLTIQWQGNDPVRKARQILRIREIQALANELLEIEALLHKSRREITVDSSLCRQLEKKHALRVWDGCYADLSTRKLRLIENPAEGAMHLSDAMSDFKAQGIIFDFDYFGDETYGLRMLESKIIRFPKDAILVIYTMASLSGLGTSEEKLRDLLDEFHIKRLEFARRSIGSVDKIVDIFSNS